MQPTPVIGGLLLISSVLGFLVLFIAMAPDPDHHTKTIADAIRKSEQNATHETTNTIYTIDQIKDIEKDYKELEDRVEMYMEERQPQLLTQVRAMHAQDGDTQFAIECPHLDICPITPEEEVRLADLAKDVAHGTFPMCNEDKILLVQRLEANRERMAYVYADKKIGRMIIEMYIHRHMEYFKLKKESGLKEQHNNELVKHVYDLYYKDDDALRFVPSSEELAEFQAQLDSKPHILRVAFTADGNNDLHTSSYQIEQALTTYSSAMQELAKEYKELQDKMVKWAQEADEASRQRWGAASGISDPILRACCTLIILIIAGLLVFEYLQTNNKQCSYYTTVIVIIRTERKDGTIYYTLFHDDHFGGGEMVGKISRKFSALTKKVESLRGSDGNILDPTQQLMEIAKLNPITREWQVVVHQNE